jgi:hypothetical protein
MKKIILGIFLAAGLLTSIVSCKKDKDNTAPKTKTQLITLAPWKFSTAEIGISATGPWNALPATGNCNADDVFTFVSDGTAKKDNGSLKCVPTNPQVETLKWSFSENDTKLTIEGFSITNFELTETSFIIIGQAPGNPAFIRTTFIH